MSVHFHTKARFITPESNALQVAVTLIDGKRERMTLNQSFTGTSPASLCILCATVVCPRRCCAPTALHAPACSLKLFHYLCNAKSISFSVGTLYAYVSKYTPGVSFTLVGGVPPRPLTDHAATLASSGLLCAMVRQTKS
jgi:hypothetical protein